jgi:group I intron endonuclease
MKSSGIYVIENLITHKVYIGSAVNFKARWSVHLFELESRKHKNSKLQRAWNKYGKEKFVFWIVEFVEDKDRLVEVEQTYLNMFQNFPFGVYNICSVAGSTFGIRFNHSKETRKRISSTQKNRIFSEEHRRKLSESRKGRIFSKETRQKMSLSKAGKSFSDEHKRKLSDALRGNQNNFDHKHSEDTKRRISESLKGLKRK